MKKTILLLVFALIATLACQKKSDVRNASEEFRKRWPSSLQKIPPVGFANVLGFMPTKAQVDLGRMLFNDTILSRNNDVSCATCHLTNHGFADGLSLSFGALGKGGPDGFSVGRSWGEGTLSLDRHCDHDGFQFYCKGPMARNSLSTINVAYRAKMLEDKGLMWDGRFGRLFHTSLLPIMTAQEMCGDNPVPSVMKNPFEKGGTLFQKEIKIENARAVNPGSGKDLEGFYHSPVVIGGVPTLRANGQVSVPNMNECLAIAVAKLRKSKAYNKLFQKAFDDEVNDTLLGKALSSFVATHVSKNTNYDKFVNGEDSLSKKQLEGFAMFIHPAGEKFQYLGKNLRGVGCIECHSPPHFGGMDFYSLGVKSDVRSSRSIAALISQKDFRVSQVGARGIKANCHIAGKTADEATGYGPDVGLAEVSRDSNDCFKFRVPSLRNVIETYPYFHHGLARGQANESSDLKVRSRLALKQVIRYHLRGPVNDKQLNFLSSQKKYFDPLYLKDKYVPVELQEFSKKEYLKYFPIALNSDEEEALLSFVGESLRDPLATQRGELGNDVSHPRSVPSELSPTINRDSGTQLDFKSL